MTEVNESRDVVEDPDVILSSSSEKKLEKVEDRELGRELSDGELISGEDRGD